MEHGIVKWAGIVVVVSALLAPTLAAAQAGHSEKMPSHPMGDQASPLLRRHHEMRQLMQDMTHEMEGMRDQMGDNAMPADMQKQMASKMKRMSAMMSRMSGLMDRPTMKDEDANRQLEQMRKQMDEMSKGGPAKDGRK